MNRIILTAIFSGLLLLGVPSQVRAAQGIEIVESGLQSVSVTLSGNVLRVTGAAGQVLQVYNVAGMRVMNVRIDSDDKRFELSLPKGCYIIKVGKFVRKIAIR